MKALATALAAGLLAAPAPALEETKPVPEKLSFKTEWKGEVIALPASFAPEMKLKGIEEIRFAPGMFESGSASFFTYVFVFSVSGEQKLTGEVIRDEMLAYYRGLAKSVLAGKDVEADTAKFAFEIKKAEAAKDAPEAFTRYSGKLGWIEPFVTAKPQVLHFELQAWSDPKTTRNYLFVCASPRIPSAADPTWKELRDIRRTFSVKE